MIGLFRSKSLALFWSEGDASKLSVPNTARVRRLLDLLEQSSRPEEMNLPGVRFHGPAGRTSGRYAVNVSGNWRLTFGWRGEDAMDVDLEDDH